MFLRFKKDLSRLSRLSSMLVVNVNRQGWSSRLTVKVVVKIVVIASPSAYVSILLSLYYNWRFMCTLCNKSKCLTKGRFRRKCLIIKMIENSSRRQTKATKRANFMQPMADCHVWGRQSKKVEFSDVGLCHCSMQESVEHFPYSQ